MATRPKWFSIGLSLTLVLLMHRPCGAVVWANAEAEAPTEQAGEMRHVGRVLYTPLRVFGGSCVWVGDRWVLTSRHGTAGWSLGSLRFDFPAHGKTRYAPAVVHFPRDAKLDFALVELTEAPDLGQPTALRSKPLAVGDPVRFGGYGGYGATGAVQSAGRFHWGTNTLTKVEATGARFVLDAATERTPREAIPSLFDSGSPMFLTRGGEAPELLGVAVGVTNPKDPKLGDWAVYTTVMGLEDWIRETAPEVRWAR